MTPGAGQGHIPPSRTLATVSCPGVLQPPSMWRGPRGHLGSQPAHVPDPGGTWWPRLPVAGNGPTGPDLPCPGSGARSRRFTRPPRAAPGKRPGGLGGGHTHQEKQRRKMGGSERGRGGRGAQIGGTKDYKYRGGAKRGVHRGKWETPPKHKLKQRSEKKKSFIGSGPKNPLPRGWGPAPAPGGLILPQGGDSPAPRVSLLLGVGSLLPRGGGGQGKSLYGMEKE